jgi:16S rRNA (uracil1498-N3)-methyltransferase
VEETFDESWFHAPIGEVGDSAALSDDEANHLLKVLRLRPGRDIVVTNGEGRVFRCGTRSEMGRLEARAVEEIRTGQARPRLHMVLGLLKGRDIEEPVEGLCQLPVAAIHLVTSDHTQEFKGQDHGRLMERLRAKSQAGLKQAKKAWSTRIHPPLPLREWRKSHPDPLVLVHPGPDRLPPVDDSPYYALIGPEGGFSAPELSWLIKEEECLTMGLGETRLRATLAPLVACGKLMGAGML